MHKVSIGKIKLYTVFYTELQDIRGYSVPHYPVVRLFKTQFKA